MFFTFSLSSSTYIGKIYFFPVKRPFPSKTYLFQYNILFPVKHFYILSMFYRKKYVSPEKVCYTTEKVCFTGKKYVFYFFTQLITTMSQVNTTYITHTT